MLELANGTRKVMRSYTLRTRSSCSWEWHLRAYVPS